MAGPLLRSLWSTTRKSFSTSTYYNSAKSATTPKPYTHARRAFSSAATATAPAAPAPALDPTRLRNVAVIAHVDHGKTTLMDRLLRQCGADIPHERALDSISLERERGITIASKVTSISWKENELNMVDTPGHADFGGEVERVVGMVEGAILVVDAGEGPLAQTKFVLAKALKYGLRPILLLNKVDRPAVSEERCDEVESLVFDLFANLGATEEQLDFPVLYASAKEGWASSTFTKSPADDAKNMSDLLDAIVRHVPPPSASLDAPFQMMVSMMEKDFYLGRILTGRISSGLIRIGDRVHGLRKTDSGVEKIEEGKVLKLMKKKGTSMVLIDSAGAGDIISMAGLTSPAIGHTVANVEVWYPASKTLAEKAAWQFSKEKGLDVVVVNHGTVMGPVLPPTLNASMLMLLRLLQGCTETYEDHFMGSVHVRDVALAHILVYENTSATGRHLCVEAISHYGDFAAMVAELYPEYNLPRLPKDTQPGLLRAKNASKKLMDLGLQFIPMEQIIKESVESLKSKGFIC